MSTLRLRSITDSTTRQKGESNEHRKQCTGSAGIGAAWGKMGFSLPGMVTPTLDVDELDKRIADMKAVENWSR